MRRVPANQPLQAERAHRSVRDRHKVVRRPPAVLLHGYRFRDNATSPAAHRRPSPQGGAIVSPCRAPSLLVVLQARDGHLGTAQATSYRPNSPQKWPLVLSWQFLTDSDSSCLPKQTPATFRACFPSALASGYPRMVAQSSEDPRPTPEDEYVQIRGRRSEIDSRFTLAI